MNSCFRLRFNLPSSRYLPFDEPEYKLDSGEYGPSVKMHSMRKGEILRDAAKVVVYGEGYNSEAAAAEAGDAWRSVVERAFACTGIGADFGERTPGGFWTNAGLRAITEASGQPALREVHGLMTYACEPPPLLMTAESLSAVAAPQRGRLERALKLAAVAGPTSRQDRLAFDLYSASFFTLHLVDARFILLMMAVETLIEQEPRADHVRQHVDQLIELTRTSTELSQRETNSILGSLRWLLVESVSGAGKRLAESLGDRLYADQKPAKFFEQCYSIRSKLVHGHVKRPTTQTVGGLAGELQRFTGHLIAGPTLIQELHPPSTS